MAQIHSKGILRTKSVWKNKLPEDPEVYNDHEKVRKEVKQILHISIIAMITICILQFDMFKGSSIKWTTNYT